MWVLKGIAEGGQWIGRGEKMKRWWRRPDRGTEDPVRYLYSSSFRAAAFIFRISTDNRSNVVSAGPDEGIVLSPALVSRFVRMHYHRNTLCTRTNVHTGQMCLCECFILVKSRLRLSPDKLARWRRLSCPKLVLTEFRSRRHRRPSYPVISLTCIKSK